jgi:hypothetical protein
MLAIMKDQEISKEFHSSPLLTPGFDHALIPIPTTDYIVYHSGAHSYAAWCLRQWSTN